MRWSRRFTGGVLSAIAAVAAVAAPAGAAPPPGLGTPWELGPERPKLYGVKPPSADPARQIHIVEGAEAADLYVETWLPVAKDGNAPPEKIPTILVMTPYVTAGVQEYSDSYFGVVSEFVARGYAVAQHHVRGTGSSGGCLEQTGALESDDGARVVEYLGRDAPWANGNVGMFGVSYDAETQIATAALGDPEKTKYLKAIIPIETIAGGYEYEFFDGVPYVLHALGTFAFYFLGSFQSTPPTTAEHALQRPGCQPAYGIEGTRLSGDFTPFWRRHELRLGAHHIKAATLLVHGHTDFNVKPIAMAGLFDRIPATTPKKGLFGIWEHAIPSHHSLQPDWQRHDFFQMVLDWFDRYLLDRDTGVERWPDVQVQASDGQWRAEPDWPTTGGPAAQLALGSGGLLGATTPTGSTAYPELGTYVDLDLSQAIIVSPGTPEDRPGAVWQTPPVTAPLHVTGQPEVDTWVQVNRAGGHLAAKLQVIGADGQPVRDAFTYGYRSLRHLDPIIDGAFVQPKGRAAPVDVPIHTVVRFHPTDLVVPVGGRLRLSFAGSVFASQPSAVLSTIRLLHDCAHPTALRFLMPHPDSPLLNVREAHEEGKPLVATPTFAGLEDGGGLATAPVCGALPKRDGVLGPARPLRSSGVGNAVALAATGSAVERARGGGHLPATGAPPPAALAGVLALCGYVAARRLSGTRTLRR